MDEVIAIADSQAPSAEELAGLCKAVSTNKEYRHPAYEKTVEYAREFAPHAFGDNPGDVLKTYRPLEDRIIRDYRESIYQPVSNSEFKRCLGVVNRVFSEGVNAISYPEKYPGIISDDETPELYFEQHFAGTSVMNFTEQVVMPCMVGDPNAVLALDYIAATDEELPEIVPTVWGSESVYLFERDTYALIKTNRKSVVSVGQSSQRVGLVYLYYNRERIYEVRQYGDQNKYLFRVERLADHKCESMPVQQLGGVMVSKDGVSYYESFFDAALPYWNKLIREDSDVDAAVVSHLYPEKVVMQSVCETCKGSGFVQNDSCSTCKGSGKVSGGSAYKHVSISDDSIEAGVRPSDVIHYVQKDIESIRLAGERVEGHKLAALQALHLHSVLGVNLLNSGAAKDIDRQDMNLFLSSISNRAYGIAEFIYQNSVPMRYGQLIGPERAREIVPVVERPIGFEYVTLAQLLEEYESAKRASVSPEILASLEIAVAEKKYGRDSIQADKVRAVVLLNPFYGMDSDDILSAKSMNPISVSDIDSYVSVNIKTLVSKAASDNSEFLKMDIEEQRSIVYAIASERLGVVADDDDPDAAAKAKIRGSVGGVQAIITAAQGVGQGLIQRETAINMLIELYGISPEAAGRMIPV